MITFFGALCWGCEETIQLDLEQAPPVVVVDALLTDSMAYNHVRLSRSVDFYYEGRAPVITNAEVQVQDNEGNTYPYFYQEEDSLYRPSPPFAGEVGKVYTLNVTIDGQTITATDTLRFIAAIDSLRWRESESFFLEPKDDDYIYEVLTYAREPKETEDFYLFKFYRNDTIERFDSETGVFYSDDIGLGEEINDLSGPSLYSLEDTARFEMYSLTPTAFKYYFDLDQLINSDGGMFSGIPANPASNIEGANAVGFFQVSAISAEEIVVGDPETKRR
jgi:hypothetical protein